MLAEDGMNIMTATFQGNVKVGIGQVVGDNLGIHSLFGFAEGFTANHPCRWCRMHRNDVQRVTVEEKLMMRTKDNYEEDLNRHNLQETGVKAECPLNRVAHFHVTQNNAPDIMHDLLEGVFPLELKLVLNELIQQGHLSIDPLNGRITSFNYGAPDSKNKPTVLSQHSLSHPDGASGQHAGQMWCLMRHIAVMLGDLHVVPEGNEYWELILMLLDCMDFIFAPVTSKEEAIFLRQLIQDHHEYFLQIFDERHLKPKHHFMTHYPTVIQALGPLKHFWVMRFEANHNFSKRLSHICTCSLQFSEHSKHTCLQKPSKSLLQLAHKKSVAYRQNECWTWFISSCSIPSIC